MSTDLHILLGEEVAPRIQVSERNIDPQPRPSMWLEMLPTGLLAAGQLPHHRYRCSDRLGLVPFNRRQSPTRWMVVSCSWRTRSKPQGHSRVQKKARGRAWRRGWGARTRLVGGLGCESGRSLPCGLPASVWKRCALGNGSERTEWESVGTTMLCRLGGMPCCVGPALRLECCRWAGAVSPVGTAASPLSACTALLMSPYWRSKLSSSCWSRCRRC